MVGKRVIDGEHAHLKGVVLYREVVFCVRILFHCASANTKKLSIEKFAKKLQGNEVLGT